MKVKLMKKLSISILFWGLLGSVWAQVTLSNQSDAQNYLEKQNAKVKGSSPFVQAASTTEISSQKAPVGNTPYIPHQQKSDLKFSNTDLGETAQLPPGQLAGRDQLLEFNASDLFSKLYYRGKSSLSLAYYYMGGVEVSNGTYNSIFDGDKSRDFGGLFVHYERYFLRSEYMQFGCALGGGARFQSGKGKFASGETSTTEFKLWTVPFDAHFLVGLSLGKFSNLEFSAGPAAMAFFQTRSDYEDGEKGKRLNQISYGYSARALWRISAANLMRKKMARLYRAQQISNYYVNLEARYEDFSHFQQEGIQVRGASFGLGFTFDFI